VKTNVRVAGHEVDFFWPAARLVVEIDGFRYHASRLSFEADRRRDADLAARGYRVVRVTWTQIERRSGELLFTLGRAFGSGRG
jgi:very-short-patch-repair endonuclease